MELPRGKASKIPTWWHRPQATVLRWMWALQPQAQRGTHQHGHPPCCQVYENSVTGRWGSPVLLGSCLNFFLPSKTFFADGWGSTESHTVATDSAWVCSPSLVLKSPGTGGRRHVSELYDFWDTSQQPGRCYLLLFFRDNRSPSSLALPGLRFNTSKEVFGFA